MFFLLTQKNNPFNSEITRTLLCLYIFKRIGNFPEAALQRGVLRKECSRNMQQIYRRTPLERCFCFSKTAKKNYPRYLHFKYYTNFCWAEIVTKFFRRILSKDIFTFILQFSSCLFQFLLMVLFPLNFSLCWLFNIHNHYYDSQELFHVSFLTWFSIQKQPFADVFQSRCS